MSLASKTEIDETVARALPSADASIDPYREFRERLLDPERVRHYSRLRPSRVVFDTLRCWASILAAWTAVAIWTEWWVVLISIPTIGTQFYALFVIGHDGMHRRLLPSVRSNDLFNDLFALGPIGAITRINNRNHLAHHRHLSTELDPDRHKHCSYNKRTRLRFVTFLTGLANVYPVIRNVFLRQHFEPANPREMRPRYSIRDIAIIMGWQAALIGGLTLAIGWWAFPVLWLMPCYLFMYLTDLSRSFMEHSHPEPDEEADDHRLITYRSNFFERLLFAPMNMNYHTVHHLWPSIPYYNLPAADREIRKTGDTVGMTWRRSYFAYLWTYFRALPISRRRRNVPRATK